MATKACIKNYWHNLIFINNLIDYPVSLDDGACFSHGWYLACDMQFFIYSIFIIVIFIIMFLELIIVCKASSAKVLLRFTFFPNIVNCFLSP